jgi:hypothetical protein
MASNLKIIGMVLLALVTGGCAGMQRPAEKDTVYPRPIEEVWPKVESLMQDKGWNVEYREGFKAASGWRHTAEGQQMLPGANKKAVLERLVAVGAPLPDGRCVVRFGRQSRVVQSIETGSDGRTTQKTVLLESRTYNGEPAPENHRASQIEEGPIQPAWVKREGDLERELYARVAPPVESAK